MWVLSVTKYILHAYLILAEVERGGQIHWNCSSNWLWVTLCMPRIKSGSLLEQPVLWITEPFLQSIFPYFLNFIFYFYVCVDVCCVCLPCMCRCWRNLNKVSHPQGWSYWCGCQEQNLVLWKSGKSSWLLSLTIYTLEYYKMIPLCYFYI